MWRKMPKYDPKCDENVVNDNCGQLRFLVMRFLRVRDSRKMIETKKTLIGYPRLNKNFVENAIFFKNSFCHMCTNIVAGKIMMWYVRMVSVIYEVWRTNKKDIRTIQSMTIVVWSAGEKETTAKISTCLDNYSLCSGHRLEHGQGQVLMGERKPIPISLTLSPCWKYSFDLAVQWSWLPLIVLLWSKTNIMTPSAFSIFQVISQLTQFKAMTPHFYKDPKTRLAQSLPSYCLPQWGKPRLDRKFAPD